jgi:Mlc titration factor MtfA (ptsG expression regulator)
VTVWPRGAIAWRGAAAAGVGTFAGAIAWDRLGVRALLVGLGVAAVFFVAGLLRYVRRARALAEPFPEAWRDVLRQRVAFYRSLHDAGRARFEDDVRIFLMEQSIRKVVPGRPGATEDVDDEAKLLIAASAAMLVHGWPAFEWPRVRDILVYPGSFDEEYASGGDVVGMVHTQGPILFSSRDLRAGFRRPKDGHNVGLHELAHVLDLTSGDADGAPAGAEWVTTAPWMKVIHDRLKKARRGKGASALRGYAATNEAELFAVAVEAFFEQPGRLKGKDPELYAMLAEYFRQDPAGAEG